MQSTAQACLVYECILITHFCKSLEGVPLQDLIYNTLLLQATMSIFHPVHARQNTTLEKWIKFKTKFCFYRQTTNKSCWNVCYNTFTSKSKINLELGIQRSMHCKAVANTLVKNNQTTQTQLLSQTPSHSKTKYRLEELELKKPWLQPNEENLQKHWLV